MRCVDALVGFDPALLTGADCAAVVTKLASVEKACAAAKALAAARAAVLWRASVRGFADAGDWLAREGGTSVGAARAALETAADLESCPQTLDAVRTGAVSLDQAARSSAPRRPDRDQRPSCSPSPGPAG